MRLLTLLACLSVPYAGQGEETLPIDDFTRILLKFDPDCSRDGEFRLEDYIVTRMLSSAEDVHSINVGAFKRLLGPGLHTRMQRVDRDTGGRHGRSGAQSLKDTGTVEREAEILRVLHLMAVSAIAGNTTKVEELLDADRKGRLSDIVNIVRKNKSLQIGGLEEKLALARRRGGGQTTVTSVRNLKFLDGIRIVENPILGERLLVLASMLPCLELEPVANQLIPPTVDKATTTDVHVKLDLVDYETLKLRMEEETANGLIAPSYARIPGEKRQLYLRWPTDPDFGASWHLHTSNGFPPIGGAGADSAWAKLVSDDIDRESAIDVDPESANHRVDPDQYMVDVAGIKSLGYSFQIGVVDPGCARNPDLIKQFWKNPDVCPGANETTFVGTGVKTNGVAYWNDCVGFDFVKHQPDPTINLGENDQHGTYSAGLIAGELENGFATAGVCPFCKVVCMKAGNENKMSDAAIFESWNYLVEKGIRVSSNPYGTHSWSEATKDYVLLAIKSLERVEHLVIASAGNMGCNVIDRFESLYLPSGLTQIASNVISVGALGRDGHPTPDSNYSPDAVDVFAPGQDILAIHGIDSIRLLSGTSPATAIVAGIAGVVWGVYPDLTMKQVRETVLNSGMPLASLANRAVHPRTVDLHRALAYASQF